MQAIADSVGLGEVVEVVAIKPRVSRLVTDQGSFHVKLLRDEGWEWLSSMQRGCTQVEEGALAAGVEMAEPVALLGSRRCEPRSRSAGCAATRRCGSPIPPACTP